MASAHCPLALQGFPEASAGFGVRKTAQQIGQHRAVEAAQLIRLVLEPGACTCARAARSAQASSDFF